MKHKFNESTLVTGHIKELLHSFNLPMIPVYTDDTVLYENRSYIKDGKIVKWTGSDFKVLAEYVYNRPIANVTKKLEMNSSIYDSYTHEYLGDYLRFIRDYHKVDLMSLYNCFGEKRPSRIYYSQKLSNNFTLNIDTDNVNFNYYILPIKFNKTYTIAVDSEIKWELVALIYSSIFVEGTPSSLVSESYRTISGSKFVNPFVYSTNFECAKDCWSKEKNLVLLLKIPTDVKSSITILEGDYTNYTSVVDGTQVNELIYDDEMFSKSSNYDDMMYDSKCSLLSSNLEVSYPFADRLIEYLLGNVITPMDEFQKNVGRVQEDVYGGVIKGYYGIWDNKLRNSIYNLLLKDDITKGSSLKYGNTIIKISNDESHSEQQETEERYAKRFIDIYDDSLSYVDRDVETLLRLL